MIQRDLPETFFCTTMSSSLDTTYSKFRRVDNESKGRHLVATKPISAGSLVFIERPLISLQSIHNSHDGALVCRTCRCFIGGPRVGLQLASGLISRQDVYSYWKDQQHKTDHKEDELEECESTWHIVPCRQQCGELYCSNKCENNHWQFSGHGLLCTGSIPETINPEKEEDNIGDKLMEKQCSSNKIHLQASVEKHPLIRFKMYAIHSNEILLLVADWIATVICLYYRKLLVFHYEGEVSSIEIHSCSSSSSSDLTSLLLRNCSDAANRTILEQVLEPYTDFTMNIWWKVASQPLLDQQEASETELTIRYICRHASRLLKEALMVQQHTIAPPFSFSLIFPFQSKSEVSINENELWRKAIQDCIDALCTEQSFARIVGSFEQNAIGIRARHPLCMDIMDRQLRELGHDALVQCLTKAGFIGDNDSLECDNGGECDVDDGDTTVSLPGEEELQVDTCQDEEEASEDLEEEDYSVDGIDRILNQLYIRGEGHFDPHERKPDDGEKEQNDQLDGDDLDYVFVPLDGTAMFSTACKMNHSCRPNILVRYYAGWGQNRPLVLQCVALRNIVEGEELCISYIDTDGDIQERRKRLESYGFTCHCTRCLSEGQDCIAGVETAVLEHQMEACDVFGSDSEARKTKKDTSAT